MNSKTKTLAAIFATLLLVWGAFAAPSATPSPGVFFVANEGQWEEPFAFKLQAGATTYFVTGTGLTIDIRQYERREHASLSGLPPFTGGLRGEDEPETVSVRGHVLKMNFVNANQHPEIVGEDRLASYSNYFLGRDSCNWRSRVGHYQRVIARNVWQGIDVEFVADPQGIKTNYHVQPYADPSQIVIEYEGLDAPLRIDGAGNLVLRTSLGELKEQKPWAFQQLNSVQKDVATSFQMLSESTYSFTTISYDLNKKIIIDPLLYGSYFGGYGPDTGHNIEIGPQGFVYIGGSTSAESFPTTPGAYETTNPHPDNNTGFISKFTPLGDSLAFSTYVGANVTPRGSTTYQLMMKVDGLGRAWGGGATASLDWPVTPNAFDTTYNDVYYEGYFYRLSADGGSLEYCSYLGGSGRDVIWFADYDFHTEALWLCGEVALSPDFPVTANAFFHEPSGTQNTFVGRFNTVSLEMEYLTYFGGDSHDFPWGFNVYGSDSVWIAGSTTSVLFPTTANAFHTQVTSQEGFISLLDLANNELLYSTLIGGEDDDRVNSMLLLDSDRVAIAGRTHSADFPVSQGAADTSFNSGGDNAFVTVFSTSGGLEHSTFLSGTSWADEAIALAASTASITVVGETQTSDFPISDDAEDSVINDTGNPGLSDVFFTRLSLDLSYIVYSTYFGGNHVEYLFNVNPIGADTFWVIGRTGSSDFPCSANAYQSEGGPLGDVFFAKYAMPPSESVSDRPTISLPNSLMLSVFPNPFNGTTSLSFNLRRASHARIRVFDVLGRHVVSEDLGFLSVGEHRPVLTLNGASGLYTILLQTQSESTTQKTFLIR